MKNFGKRLKLLLLYGGYTKDEFDRAWESLEHINARVMKLGSILVAVVMLAIVLLPLLGVDGLSEELYYYYIAFAAADLLLVAASLISEKINHRLGLIWTYLFMTLVISFGIIVGVVASPDELSMMFIIFMTIFPICFCDRPLRFIIFLLLSVAAMLSHSYFLKNVEGFRLDCYNISIFLVLDIIVSTYYMHIKLGAAINNYKLEESTEELNANIDMLQELRDHLNEQVEEQTWLLEKRRKKYQNLSNQIMMSMSAAIDAKDKYTNGHSYRVAVYSKLIAERLGYSAEKQEEIYFIGLLHDVGKIGIPDSIINKPSRLTDEEFAMIKTHPAIGAKILDNISEIPGLSIGAHWHHERYDGKGYPDGLAGEDIPETARIIGVADAYDAMTSNRSYRESMPQEKVREQIEKGLGTQFDPKFGAIMLQLIDEDTAYIMKGNTFAKAEEE